MPEVLLDFFKKYELYDKNMFNYFNTHLKIINVELDPNLDFIGCFPEIRNEILVNINLILPTIVDDKTLFICLHEYIHAMELYKQLNKKYVEDDDYEVLPISYEKLFVLDNPQFLNYYEKRENYLKNTDIVAYRRAFNRRDLMVKKLKK